MKGTKFSLVLIIGVAVLFTGCGPREGEEAPGEPLEIIETEEDREPQKEVVEPDGSEGETEAIKAVYVGRIDGNFVEILQGGEFVTYAFDQEAEDAVNPGGMASYSGVDLVVGVDQDKQKRIQSLTLADPPGVGNAPEMQRAGRIDTLFGVDVCLIEGEPYWLAHELVISSSKTVEEGEGIDFSYYRDAYGRRVITSYTRLFTESGRIEEMTATSLFVDLTGNPEEIPAREYRLSPEIAASLEGLQLQTGEMILFRYRIEEDDTRVITILDRMNP